MNGSMRIITNQKKQCAIPRDGAEEQVRYTGEYKG